jgi:hypothetical protein
MMEELTLEKQNEILKSEEKSWFKIVCYLLVAYFPVVLGIYCYIAVPLSSEKINMPPKPKLVQMFIPVFLVFVIVESLVDLFREKKYYRLNDTFSSLSMGIYQIIFNLVFSAGTYDMFVYLNQKYSLVEFAKKQSDYNWLIFLGLKFLGLNGGHYL